MSKYGNYELEIKANVTTDFEFVAFPGKVVLTVKPATEINKPYYNALLRSAKKSAKQVAAGNMNTNLVESQRQEDRELYAKYIVTGWSGVLDDKGKDVDFSKEECLDFLSAIRFDFFDELRSFCAVMSNFSEQGFVDVEGTAKNS